MAANTSKFKASNLANLDREVLNKSDWTDAEIKALVAQAAKAGDIVVAADQSAVVQQSAAAYVLQANGRFDATGSKKEYADEISRSTTRVGDFILYGTAMVKHGIEGDSELFKKLTRGASGGDRKTISDYLAQDEIDLAEFEQMLDDAIATEARKAQERKDKRAKESAEKAKDVMNGKARTPESVLIALNGILMAVGDFAGHFNETQVSEIAGVAEQLVAISAVPMEDVEVEQAA